MHRYTITIETDHLIVPGNADHFEALLSNPANRGMITNVTHEEV